MTQLPIHVLIVDDEEMVRLNLADFLEDEGFEVTVVPDAEEALETLNSQRFNISIVDMRLTGMDGNQFIKKAHLKDKSLKFIIHTGTANYSVPENLKKIGITERQVFIKPIIDMSALSDAILILSHAGNNNQ